MLPARHVPQRIARSLRSHHHPRLCGLFTLASSNTWASFPMVILFCQKQPLSFPQILSLYVKLIELSQHRFNQRYQHIPPQCHPLPPDPTPHHHRSNPRYRRRQQQYQLGGHLQSANHLQSRHHPLHRRLRRPRPYSPIHQLQALPRPKWRKAAAPSSDPCATVHPCQTRLLQPRCPDALPRLQPPDGLGCHLRHHGLRHGIRRRPNLPRHRVEDQRDLCFSAWPNHVLPMEG